MSANDIIDLLASDDKDAQMHQVISWQESRLVTQYTAVFLDFSAKVEGFVQPLAFAECKDIGIDRNYGFGVSLFGGSKEIHAQLNFQRVDGFNLMAYISLTSNPNCHDADTVHIDITKDGTILNPGTGRPPESGIGKITDQAEIIIGAVIREAVPFFRFPQK